tara:strand:- start:1331 stop:1528 length:198 start_codon:yes stop_codon:yes gene_type:complete
MKNKALEKLQTMTTEQLHEERFRYIENDCDGHDVNLRLGYMNEISNLLDARMDEAAKEVRDRLPK